jgi:DNA-binding MarR family transcriptional regulator
VRTLRFAHPTHCLQRYVIATTLLTHMMILLKTMEQQGLINRSSHPRHPNVLELHMTEVGQEALHAAHERVDPIENGNSAPSRPRKRLSFGNCSRASSARSRATTPSPLRSGVLLWRDLPRCRRLVGEVAGSVDRDRPRQAERGGDMFSARCLLRIASGGWQPWRSCNGNADRDGPHR